MRRSRTVLSAVAVAALAGALAVPSTATAAKKEDPVTSAPAAATDPLRTSQYGLDQVRAEQAWPASTGEGAVIAVVDTGVDLDHPDLVGQLLPGATFTCGGAPAPCGDGGFRGPDGRNDGDEHGTHVAGIAAAASGNGIGITGVAPNAKILPVKVLEAGSGSFEEIAAGIRWSADQGADVINLSLGALPGFQLLTYTGLVSDTTDAVAYARSRGSVVVAAAGNDVQFPLCGTPAFEDGALCVTSTDKRELPSAFSNNGLKPDLMAVAAPGGSLLPACGEDIVSTVPTGTGTSASCGYGTAYDEYAGTSMAAPHVAGVAALLAAQGRSDDQVLDALLTTSRQAALGLTGLFTPQYGWGIVDAEAAVAAPR
jgi:subtilisin family serine protease